MPEKLAVSPLFRRLTLVFVLVLSVIILVNDLGMGGELFRFLYAIPYADKVGHFTLFGLLSLLVSLGYPTGRVRLWFLPVLKSSLFLAVLITLEEITQIPLSNRNFSLLDISAGIAGVYLFGELGAYLIRDR